MSNKDKRGFGKNINSYFVFVALAFGLSAYLLLVDNYSGYKVKTNILITPKNIKTSIHLDKIKESIIVIAKKNNLLEPGVILKNDKKTDLIEIQSSNENKKEAVALAEKSAQKILNLSSQHYDVKKDLTLGIVSREVTERTYFRELIFMMSIASGLILAWLVQIILGLAEKIGAFIINKRIQNKEKILQSEKYLGDFFKVNREKIEKLSSSFPLERNRVQREQDEDKINKNILKENYSEPNDEPYINFKRAASPPNLPIAQDDFDKIIQGKEDISNEKEIIDELGIISEDETHQIFGEKTQENKIENIQPIDQVYADNLKEALGEPTEEDFKKRLNQLLGNK